MTRFCAFLLAVAHEQNEDKTIAVAEIEKRIKSAIFPDAEEAKV